MRRRLGIFVFALTAAAAGVTMPLTLHGQIGTFAPDWTFTGAALTGTRQVGQANWTATNGEIVAVPSSPAGGWLLLPGGFQDVQVGGEFRCSGECRVGVMLRSETAPDGTKGLYGVLAGGARAAQAIVVGADGAIGAPEPLTRPAPGQYRLAPPAPQPGAAGARAGGGGGGRGGAAPAPAMPFTSKFPPAPSDALRPNDWNQFELIVDADILRVAVNSYRPAGYFDGSNGLVVATDGKGGGYGPVALYVGGTGEVRFRHLALKDLNRRITPAPNVSARFRAQHIEDFYYGWSMAAGDFNHDGVLDVTTGNRYYLGPKFEESRELYLGQPYNPAKEYGPAMVNYAADYTGDGWDDILVVESRPPVLYVNPRGESRRWTRYAISPAVTSEAIAFKDVDGDGKANPIFAGGNVVQWIAPDPANPTAPWKVYVVSTPGPPGASIHGVGGGDVNGDGRLDIVVPHGWYEQPASGPTTVPWTFHQEAFGRAGNAGGEFEIFDVNGDKLPDIVTSLAAHGFGLAWYEQKKSASGGERTWVEHVIMGDFAAKNPGGVTFTELHALTAADIDGDGIKDIVTGKRRWAHEESYVDPDPMGPGVVYVFRTIRDPKAPGGARFQPELIHNRSGVGSMVQTADLNKDGAPDVIVGTNTGGWIFWNQRPAARGR
ncbi:MAG: VCBS repeat-containing protein [Acidobacteria bacterium]|nr:VCBS repeat-containing protein [Acidobacteriota bacterium]